MLRLFSILLLAGCMGPFFRGTYDNRPDGSLEIVRVLDDGKIELTDGRTVRLFGVDVPTEGLRSDVGQRVSVEVILPTDPPAVELIVWRQAPYCGNGLSSWYPFHAPLEGYLGLSVASNAARCYPIREADLSAPTAPKRLVKRLREYAALRAEDIARWERSAQR